MAASKRDGPLRRQQRLGQGLDALKHWKAAARQAEPPAAPVPPAPPPGPTDQQLLRAALSAVRPLDDRHANRRPPAGGQANAEQQERLRRLRDHASLSADEPPTSWSDLYEAAGLPQGEDHQYLAGGQPADILSRLRRGQWPIHASVDLHGSTLDEARARLDRFLASCLAHDMRCVRVIHGQGHGSDGQPVLRHTVRRWLAQLPSVQAFVECAPGDGGAGALRVLLRPQRGVQPAG